MAGDGQTEGWFRDRFGLVLLSVGITVLVLLLFDLPRRSSETTLGEVVVSLLVVTTLVVALLAAGVRRPVLRFAIIAALVFVVAAGVSYVVALDTASFMRWFWFVFVLSTPFVVLVRLVAKREVTLQVLLGAAAVYLLFAVTFMFLYLAIDSGDPGSFFGAREPTTSFMYFALVTITTLGYGDLAPVSQVARAASVATAVTGQVYLVFIVARMVGLYATGEPTDEPSN